MHLNLLLVRATFALIVNIILAACHSTNRPQNIDGGGCTFRTDSFPIRVVQISQQGKDTSFDLFFRYVDRNYSLDTAGGVVIYSVLNNGHHVAQSKMTHYGVKPGYTCTLIESQTISGGCSGGHTISLEPWQRVGTR